MGFDLNSVRGLAAPEVGKLLSRDGYNELPSAKQRRVLRIVYDIAREPMFLLLLACGSIYLILGDAQEAAMLLGFVFFIMGITLFRNARLNEPSRLCAIFPVPARW